MQLFHEAERRIRSIEGQQKYPKLEGWWRRKSHRINGVAGYQVPEETAVSEAFIEEMENAKRDIILNGSGLSRDFANIDLLEFAAEVPRRQKKGIGRKAKPTDFRFYRSGLGEVELRIEAKVIVDDKDIGKNYLSPNGLGRFSDPVEPYTDTDDRNAWQGRINAGMASAAIARFQHELQQNGQQLLFSQTPYTHEKTPPQREVLVFHLVMELDCSPSARGAISSSLPRL
jgi:hypothetical protein